MNKTIFLILLTLSIQTQAKEVSLALSWKHQFQFAGYYVAKEMGFYSQAGLDVDIKEYDLKRDNSKDVAEGKYEFGVGHSSLILDKLNAYPQIILLNAIHQSSPFILLSKKREDIKSIKDVLGKKVMMSRDQTTTASINAMLFSLNLKAGGYEIVDTSFKTIDLINGTADFMASYSSNEPYHLKQKGIEYTIFDPKEFGYNFYSDILFTSESMIRNSQKVVDAFQLASLKGWKYAYENIDETVELILKKYNTQNRSREALRYEAKTLKALTLNKNMNFGEINPIRLKEIATTYRLLNLIKKNKKVDFDSFIYNPQNDFTFRVKKTAQEESINFDFFQNLYFQMTMLIVMFVTLTSLYFRLRMAHLLKKKTTELNLKNIIFDKNVCSSQTDLDGVITNVSQAFCALSGYSKEELIGREHNVLRDKETSLETYKDLWITIASGHTWRGELKNRKKDSTEYWINAVISPLFDEEKNIVAYESVLQNVTLKKILQSFNAKLEEEVAKKTATLKKLANTDKLTGIYNRLKIDEELSKNLNYYKEHGEIFSIILMDIDFFKLVNDTHGHQVGDTVLKELTKEIKKSVRASDTFGRWGGEEFMLICSNTSLQNGYNIAQNIRKSIESYKFSRVSNVTISVGVACVEETKTLTI